MYEDLLGKPKKKTKSKIMQISYMIPMEIKIQNGQSVFGNGLVLPQDVLEDSLHTKIHNSTGLFVLNKHTGLIMGVDNIIGKCTGYKITGEDVYCEIQFLAHQGGGKNARTIKSLYTAGTGVIDPNRIIQKGYQLLYLYANWKTASKP
jgi:hypothetical protein